MTPAKFKQHLKSKGQTIAEWAVEHGYPYRAVSRVLNGVDKGHYGRAHTIATAMGLKPAHSTASLSPACATHASDTCQSM